MSKKTPPESVLLKYLNHQPLEIWVIRLKDGESNGPSIVYEI